MSASSRLRAPNPHLGAYYGIVASAFVSLAIMLAMLEQLGWSETFVAETMVGVPLVLYLIMDLDRPNGGLITNDQQAMIETAASLARFTD